MLPPVRLVRVRPGRAVPLRRRSAGTPDYWRDITFRAPGGKAGSHRVAQWVLVLVAKGIPHRIIRKGSRERLYVPALLEELARREIVGYEDERLLPTSPPPPPQRSNTHFTLFSLLVLIVWHGVRMGWWGYLPPLPDLAPEAWAKLGTLDVYRVFSRHEWYRTVTALTLHADSQHLFSNVLFGAFFLIPLCRRIGLGAGWLLTLLAGTVGNVLNALSRPAYYSSLGASTAVFGAVGLLSGLLAMENGGRGRKRMLIPLAAGLGLLGMLGSEGERTDFGAHLFGLLAGIVLGMGTQYAVDRYKTAGLANPPQGIAALAQPLMGLCTVGIAALCWWLALR